MRHIILATMLILVVLSLSLPVGATDATFIKSKTDDGSVLILGNGSVWEVVAKHRNESKEWSLGDRITVPDSKDCLFNISHGEAVDAQPLQTNPQQEYRR